MNNIYLFDVDGTLTPARQKMDVEFSEFFKDFAVRNNVFLVSGSDFSKIQEQVPRDILDICNGVFGCSGAEYFEKNEVVYRKQHEFDPAIVRICQNFVSSTQYLKQFGNYIEFRTGMINVSAVGRLASNEERHAYFNWDKLSGERSQLLQEINNSSHAYEASAGGEISVDIVPTGWNKSVVKNEVLRMKPGARLFFFGDRMAEDGNDFPLAKALNSPAGMHEAIAVEGYCDTWDHLKNIMSDWVQKAA